MMEADGRGVLGLVLDLVGGSLVTVVYGSWALAAALWLAGAGACAVGAWAVGVLLEQQGQASFGDDYGAILYVMALVGGAGGGVLGIGSALAVQGVGVMGAVGTQVSHEAIGGMGRVGAAGHVLLGLLGLGGTAAAIAFGFIVGGAPG